MPRITAALLAAFLAVTLGAVTVLAATFVVVTPTNTRGWSTADTRPGGTVEFVLDTSAPRGDGALELTTDLTTTAKAQYLHAANSPLAGVTELGYWTRQVSSAVFPMADPSYQLILCLNGVTATGACNPSGSPIVSSSFTTLVFEPYQNGVVVPGTWQEWDVDQGLFWSTRTVICTGGPAAGQGVTGGAGGAPFYTLAEIKTMCPNAVAIGFGVNIGSNNPGYVVRTDLVGFDGTVYDFEVTNQPTDKNQCKNGGYVDYTDADGQPFKNQGQCIKAANHGDGGGGEG